MISYDQFMNGTAKYIEDDILKKMSGYQKWLMGTAVGIGIKRIDDMYDKIVSNPIVEMLGLIDENDMIDDDVIYEELKKQAHTTPAVLEIPLIGKITMNEQDVDKWHNYIHM